MTTYDIPTDAFQIEVWRLVRTLSLEVEDDVKLGIKEGHESLIIRLSNVGQIPSSAAHNNDGQQGTTYSKLPVTPFIDQQWGMR